MEYVDKTHSGTIYGSLLKRWVARLLDNSNLIFSSLVSQQP